ncbi:HYR domain-containing protein [Xanthomarina sp. GH4-25]|uniref:HYR domain-containing protein n=1 Tax=Xanthomarina sp. GH4-25 TaxID=3349335 RepID=UPI003877ED1F
MKRLTTLKSIPFIVLLSLFSLWSTCVFAQAPTTPSSNLSISGVDGNRFSVNFTRGNGAKRIMVVKADTPVTAIPIDGTDYLAGTFGVGNEIAPGEFVVYEGTSNNFTITGLTHSITYYFKIFEFNGSDFSTEYLTSSYLESNQATLTNPSIQASNISFSNVLGSNMTASWTNGSGTGRILIARANSPVDVEPQNLVNYNSYGGGFGNGTYEIGTGNYVLYAGGGTSVNIFNIEPNTTYYFALYEYNGSNGKVYLTSTSVTNPTQGAIADQITLAYPTINTNAMTFSGIDGNRFNFYSSGSQRGNGEKRLVIAKLGSPVTAIPVDGYEYTGNTSFGAGHELATDEFVIFSGTGNIGHTLTNLNPYTTYYFKVYEYNGSGTNTYYLKTNDSNGDPVLEVSQSTLSYPVTQASNITFSNVLGSSMTASWTNGSGVGRILVARANNPVDIEPQDLVNYNNYRGGFGTSTYEIGTGNYVLYAGGGTSVDLFNLEPNISYHFSLFEYNGSNGKLYLTSSSTINPIPGTTSSQITNAYPTINSNTMTFSGIDGNRFNFYSSGSQRGNGEKRLVIAKLGSPVTAVPVDGFEYTANTTFGTGHELATDEFVVFSGTGNIGHTLTNLQPYTTYYFKVYEYNGTGTETYYLTTNDSNGDPVFETSQSTLSYPVTQASNITFNNVLGSSMTVSWTNGSGAGRILVARANSPVDIEPQDLVNYNNYRGGFGTSTYEIGTGNYVLYAGGGTSVDLFNLEPNITYHFALYEYNGSHGKLYLTSSSTINPIPGAIANQITQSYPTINANIMTFNGIDGNRFNFYLSGSQRGNGEKRLVIAKLGSPVTAVPIDGFEYTANTVFGTGYELATDEFVVFSGNGNIGHTLTNLQPHTTYHFKVFEYNGSGTNTYYLINNDANGDPVYETSQATVSYPTVQTNNIFINSKTTTSFNVNWTNGDGSGRILIARANNPVDVEPQDLVSYSNFSGGYGNSNYEIGTGNYVLYGGTAISDNVYNLQPGTNYHFALFEYNGSSGKAYLRPGYTFEAETYGERPTIQVSNIEFEDIGATSMLVKFTRGNGSSRLVVAKEGTPVDVEPSDFTTYLADGSFGVGEEIGTNNFVVYNGTDDEFQLSDLNLSTNYHFAFFEYAINQNGELYLTPGSTASQATPNPPTVICSDLNYTPPCDSDVILDWIGGNGEGRIVILSESLLNTTPVNATNYTASFDYGFGDAIGNGFIVFKGSGELAPPNLLQQLTNYYVNIYEYNGTEEDPIFNMTPLQGLIGDITPPNVICENIQVVLDANGNGSITADDVGSASTDNCGIVLSEIDISAFDCSHLGENDVTFTATDSYGNTNSCVSTVTVIDETVPVVITQNITIQLDVNGNATIAEDAVNNGSTDACGPLTFDTDITTFDCSYLGENTVVLTVTDGSDNSATETAIVTVEDSIAPTIITQNITIQLDANGNATIAEDAVNNGSTDACGPLTFDTDITTFDCSHLGENTVVLTVTDGSDNSTTETAIVTVEDTIAPSISSAGNINTDTSNGDCSATLIIPDATLADNCQSNLSWIMSGAISDIGSGQIGTYTFPLGETTITYTNTDGSGNSVSDVTLITISDTENPSIVGLPSNISVNNDLGVCGAIVNWTEPTATDNCSVMSFVQTIGLTNGSTFPLGITTITYVVTDGSNNSYSDNFTITVIDNEPPSLTSVSDFNVTPTSGCDFTIPDYTSLVTISDNCSVNTISQSPLAGTVISNHGTTQEIIITAVDDSGNSNNTTFSITIFGTNTYYADSDGDNYGDFNNPIQDCTTPTGYVENSLDCDDTNNAINPDATEIECNDIDENCNGMEDDKDTISPVCLTQDITIQLDETGNATILATDIDNGSYDSCGIDTMEVSPSSFNSSNVGENTVTLTITDFYGNSVQCTATVTVDDPTLTIVENELEAITSFPNPFNQEVTFVIPNKLLNNRFQIILYDLNGKEIINTIKTLESTQLKITNLNNLQEGMYLIRLINTSNGHTTHRKLIKK